MFCSFSKVLMLLTISDFLLVTASKDTFTSLLKGQYALWIIYLITFLKYSITEVLYRDAE